ncbi:MAG: hypothetical protein E7082_02890 [Bacteroidales bacterium]|nr:hypothetical protein [Bacteroidales bacterium]
MNFKQIMLMAATAALTLMNSCSSGSVKNRPGSTRIACDDTFENIIAQEIDVFEYAYSNRKRMAAIVPSYVSQAAAFDSLLNPDCPINTIVAGRKLTKAERTRLGNQKKKPREEQIAVDAVAIIANTANDVPELSMPDLRKILTGEYATWEQVWPASNLDSIRVMFDQNGSSLVQYMKENVMDGQPFGENVFAQGSSAAVFDAVMNRRGAIGIIGVSWISSDMTGRTFSREEIREMSTQSDTTRLAFSDKVRVMPIFNEYEARSYKPYQEYIFDGRYPLHRPIYMITTMSAQTVAGAFYSFVTGTQGQKVILLTGVLPARVTPRVVQLQ